VIYIESITIKIDANESMATFGWLCLFNELIVIYCLYSGKKAAEVIMGGKTKTTWVNGAPEGTPKRGQGKRTLLLRALEKHGVSESEFYEAMVSRALDKGDQSSGAFFREVLIRIYPPSKATSPLVEFKISSEDPAQQIRDVLQSVADGDIPADVGQTISAIIKDVMSVTEITELAERLERVEALLKEQAKDA